MLEKISGSKVWVRLVFRMISTSVPSMRTTADGPNVTRLGPKLCQPSLTAFNTVTRASIGSPA